MSTCKSKRFDVAYVQFRKGTASKTVKLGKSLLIDFDKKDRILGIEILAVSELAPALKITSFSNEAKADRPSKTRRSMRKNYDFSQSENNPYAKKIKQR